MVQKLAEHGGHHGVATMHVTHILMDDDGNETRRRKRLAGDGTPSRTGDTIVIAGRQQSIERRQCLAESRVTQIVAPAAKFAERGSVVAGQRLFVIAADVGRSGRLDETCHVDIVESLRQRPS